MTGVQTCALPILVTHDMSAVREFCNRAILIDDGLIKVEGNPSEVADEYS